MTPHVRIDVDADALSESNRCWSTAFFLNIPINYQELPSNEPLAGVCSYFENCWSLHKTSSFHLSSSIRLSYWSRSYLWHCGFGHSNDLGRHGYSCCCHGSFWFGSRTPSESTSNCIGYRLLLPLQLIRFAFLHWMIQISYPVAREVLYTLRVIHTLRVNFYNVQIPSQNISRYSMRLKINPFPLFDPIIKTLSIHGNPIGVVEIGRSRDS